MLPTPRPLLPLQNRFEEFVAETEAALNTVVTPPSDNAGAAEEPENGAAAEAAAPTPPPMSPPAFARSPSQSSVKFKVRCEARVVL